jgi:hypothetical protein
MAEVCSCCRFLSVCLSLALMVVVHTGEICVGELCHHLSEWGRAVHMLHSKIIILSQMSISSSPGFVALRPFSHWGDTTAIWSRKKLTTLNSWWVVIASLSRWWDKCHYELKVRPVGDCKVIFFLDWITVMSPQWESGLTDALLMNNSGRWCMLCLSFSLFSLLFYWSPPADIVWQLYLKLHFHETSRHCVMVCAVWLVVTKLLQPVFFKLVWYLRENEVKNFYAPYKWDFIYFLLKIKCGLYMHIHVNTVFSCWLISPLLLLLHSQHVFIVICTSKFSLWCHKASIHHKDGRPW